MEEEQGNDNLKDFFEGRGHWKTLGIVSTKSEPSKRNSHRYLSPGANIPNKNSIKQQQQPQCSPKTPDLMIWDPSPKSRPLHSSAPASGNAWFYRI